MELQGNHLAEALGGAEEHNAAEAQLGTEGATSRWPLNKKARVLPPHTNFHDLQEIFKAEQRGLPFHRYFFLKVVPEWRRAYVHYSKLSKAIVRLVRRAEMGALEEDGGGVSDEGVGRVPVMSEPSPGGGGEFLQRVALEIDKVESFYLRQHDQIYRQCQALLDQLNRWRALAPSNALVNRRKVGESKPTLSFIRRKRPELEYSSTSSSSDDELDDDEATEYASRRFTVNITSQNLIGRVDDRKKQRRFDVAVKAFDDAGTEMVRGVRMLSSYCALNKLALIKIATKHDNFTRDFDQIRPITPAVETMMEDKDFVKGAEELKSIEERMTNELLGALGNGARRLLKLTRPETKTRSKRTVSWAAFVMGICAGVSVGLLAMILYLTFTVPFNTLPSWQSSLLVHRCVALPILMTWLTGVNMYVWRRRRINYKFINEIVTSQSIPPLYVWALASALTMVALLSFMLYLLSARGELGGLPARFYPFILFVLLVLFLVNPLNIALKDTRYWILGKTGRVLASPFRKVHFTDFYLADQFTSMALFFFDLEFSVCYCVSDVWTGGDECVSHAPLARHIIALFPFLWRFLQCLRRYRDSKDVTNLWNAGKYTTGMLVVLSSGISFANQDPTIRQPSSAQIGYIVCAVVAFCYTCTWDFYMDWGFFEKGSRHRLLRDELLYDVPRNWVYYFAMATNAVLRLTWVIAVFPLNVLGLRWFQSDLFRFGLAVGEVVRRFQWNMFRMENEMANNCGRFRAIKEVPLPFDGDDSSDSDEQLIQETEVFAEEPSTINMRHYVPEPEPFIVANEDDSEMGDGDSTADVGRIALFITDEEDEDNEDEDYEPQEQQQEQDGHNELIELM